MSKKTSIAHLLENGSNWEVLPDGNFKVRLEAGTIRDVPSKILESEHPYFPKVLQAMLAYEKEVGHSLDGSLVYFTHELLTFGVFEVNDIDGIAKTIVDIDEPHIPDNDTSPVTLNCVVVGIKYTDIDGISFPFAVDESWQRIKVSREELTKRIPGWENRLVVGKDLGLEGKQLVSYIFKTQSNTMSTTDIDNLTFE